MGGQRLHAGLRRLAATRWQPGRLHFGRQKTLIWGLGIFILASLGCGAALNALFLDIARAIKGVGAALLLTSALASIGHTFHDEVERAKAWAFWGGCMGVAMTAAPTLGGLITEYVGWRWIFYLNLPVRPVPDVHGLACSAAIP